MIFKQIGRYNGLSVEQLMLIDDHKFDDEVEKTEKDKELVASFSELGTAANRRTPKKSVAGSFADFDASRPRNDSMRTDRPRVTKMIS